MFFLSFFCNLPTDECEKLGQCSLEQRLREELMEVYNSEGKGEKQIFQGASVKYKVWIEVVE